MATGDRKVNIFLKKFLSQQNITENFFDFLEKKIRDLSFRTFRLQGLFEPNPDITPPLSADTADSFDIAIPLTGTDGPQGNILTLDPLFADNIPFENATGVDYFVGLRFITIPRLTEINVRTGKVKYSLFEDGIGEKADPDSVVDDGDETLTLIVDSVCEAGVSNAGRKVLVYLKDPVSQVQAFEELSVIWDGSNNKIETTTALGQTLGNISTDATKYEVILLGATVKRNTNLSLDPNVVYLGKITGDNGNPPSTFDFIGVNKIIGVSEIQNIVDSTFAFLSGGGNITWNLSTETLTLGADLNLRLPHRSFDFDIAATSVASIADGDVLYIVKDQIGGTKVMAKQPNGGMPNTPEAEPIAFREGNSIIFRNGTLELEGDASTPTVGRIDGITQDLLDYMGADNESDADPDYLNALGSAIQNLFLIDSESLTRGLKRLEQRDDVVVKIDYVDLVSTSLPAGLNHSPDGTPVANGERVLFTNTAIEGIYEVSGVGVALVWTALPVFGGSVSPSNASLAAVKKGTDYFKTVWQRLNTGDWQPQNLAELVDEQTGFESTTRDDSELLFVPGTRTFTIQPKAPATFFDIAQRGRVRRYTTAQNIVIPDVSGNHFIYFDENGVIQTTQVFTTDIILNYVFITAISWDAVGGEAVLFTDERHGAVMDGRTHYYLHNTLGVRWVNGLAANFNDAGDGSADAHAQVGIGGGRIFDEDLEIQIVDNAAPSNIFEQDLSLPAKLPILYRDGVAGDWRKVAATSFPFTVGGTTLMEFNDVSGPYTRSEATDGNFVAMWIFATNDINHPVVAVMGQREDTSLANAQANNTFETLSFGTLPSLEMKVLYRMIWEVNSAFTNSVNAAVRDVRDLRQAIDVSLAAAPPSAHSALTGLQNKDHGAPAIFTGPNSATPPTTFGGTIPNTDDDMGKVLLTLDKYFKDLQLREHPTNKKRVILTGIGTVKTDNTAFGQKLSNLLPKFSGAEIDPKTGIIYEDDGTTPLGINFIAPTVAASQFRHLSVNLVPSTVNANNTINIQLLVLVGDADGATADAAPRAPFSGSISVGSFFIQRNAGDTDIEDILQANITQLGVGAGGEGGGAGDASEIQSIIDNAQNDSLYALQAPVIFNLTQEDLIDTATASFSIVEQVFKFVATNELLTVNLIDFNEYTDEKDIGAVDVIVFQNVEGDVDPNLTVEASKNGGNSLKSVAMERVGQTGTFRGRVILDEPTDPFQSVFATTTTPVVLNATTQQKLAMRFSPTEETTISQVAFQMSKLGSPSGFFKLKLVRDNGGVPSTDSNDLLWTLPIQPQSNGLPGAVALQQFNVLPAQVVPAGTYFLVAETDAVYKANFNAGVDEIRIHGITAGGSGIPAAFDGAVWSTLASSDLAFQVDGTTVRFDVLDEYDFVNQDADIILNATTQQEIAQRFVPTVMNAYKRIRLRMNKVEAVAGNLDGGQVLVHFAADNGGDAGEILSSASVNMEDLPAGQSDVDMVIPQIVKDAGTYHILIQTNALYKTTLYDAGNDELSIRGDATSPTPAIARRNNGTAWSDIAGTSFVYGLDGYVLDLRVKVTASAAMDLQAIGVLFDEDFGTIISGARDKQDFFFHGTDSPPANNEFEVTGFEVDREVLMVHDPDTGQFFMAGGRGNGLSVDGQKFRFPSTFSFDPRPYHLKAFQLQGSVVEQSSVLQRIIADQFMASTDASLNKGVPGRGIKVQQKETAKVIEITVNEFGDIELIDLGLPS